MYSRIEYVANIRLIILDIYFHWLFSFLAGSISREVMPRHVRFSFFITYGRRTYQSGLYVCICSDEVMLWVFFATWTHMQT